MMYSFTKLIMVTMYRSSIYLHFTMLLITTINSRFDSSSFHIYNCLLFLCLCLSMDIKHVGMLQLGARSSEEAARWIRSLMDAALKVSMLLFGLSIFLGCILNMLLDLQECPNKEANTVGFSKRKRRSFRLWSIFVLDYLCLLIQNKMYLVSFEICFQDFFLSSFMVVCLFILQTGSNFVWFYKLESWSVSSIHQIYSCSRVEIELWNLFHWLFGWVCSFLSLL